MDARRPRVTLALDGRIEAGGASLPLAGTLDLLEAIAATRSIQGAAARAGLSYRGAWGKLAALEAALGRRAAAKTKGHGTELTAAGEALRAALDAARRRLEAPLAREVAALGAALAALPGAGDAPAPPLRLAASHDPTLVDALGGLEGIALQVCGSSEALEALRAGRADAAGCHFGTAGDTPPAAVLAGLRKDGLRALPLFRRAQGLMTAPGNPLGLRSIADLARSGARFVNRQRGSGTRAWFDRMLAAAGLEPAAIRGHGDEEFTHQAVAAVVAAGRADAGMGAEAAARRFGLHFRKLGEETYFLVLPARDARDRRVRALVARMRTARGGPAGRGPRADARRRRTDEREGSAG
jgi:molybdate transport repressor ModE-like protein